MKKKRDIALKLIFLAAAAFCYGAEPVDFYATVSSSDDSSMVKMTTDLFYTQFQSIDGYSLNDRRTVFFDADTMTSENISFYAEIQESADGGWVCTLNACRGNSQNVSLTKKYDSYYKILLDAKPSIDNLMTNLTQNLIQGLASDSYLHERKDPKNARELPDNSILDSLAGTWTGEELIEKILILRGGRGFVIFKNGASMNISVAGKGKDVTVTQSSKSNASYFPELKRETALKNAGNASPIEWELHLEQENVLSGVKKTLVQDDKSATGVSRGEINVVWKKK